jgi:hypothetical protein
MGGFDQLMPDIYGSYLRGQEHGKQTNLEKLGAQYFAQGSSPQLLAQIAGNGGNAMAYQQADRVNHEDEVKQLAQAGRVFLSLPPEQQAAYYPQFADQAKRVLKMPYLPPYDPGHVEKIAQLVDTLDGGSAAMRPMNVAPGGEVFDPTTNKVLHANTNFRPPNPTYDEFRGGYASPPGAPGGPGFTQVAPQRSEPYREPPKTYAPLSAEEVAAMGLPAGTVAQRGSDGQINIISKPDPQTRLSATQLRQANAAKQKLIDLQSVKNQLALVRQKFAPLQGSLSAGGFGQGMIPTVTGKQFDGAVSLLSQFIRKMTRTPGEGSMSDWEGKLALLANPNRGDYEAVTADKLDQLDALVNQIEQGYSALLQDNTAPPAQSAPANQPRRIKNPQTGEIRELRGNEWVKVN